MSITATSVYLAQRPEGLPDESTWEIRQHELPTELNESEILVKVNYLSLDPAMRGWLNDVRSYVPPVQIGEIMRALGTGEVLESNNPNFSPGDRVQGLFGVTDYAISDGRGVTGIDLDVAAEPTWLGALGMPGMTGYFGLLDVGELQDGDTVLISAAAGAVGSVAGQLAKARGCRVIGIAGGEEKCAWLTEIGFDEAINYKNEKVLSRLREVAPDGINVFFDNVGGTILDAGLANLARGARVVICGAVSTYNDPTLAPGPSRYMSLLVFRARMQGFVVFDYRDRYPEAVEAIAAHISNGSLVARETVVGGGVRGFPEALLGLFQGVNTGKLVLEI
ncbi:NADP-dependent oxidoreductase [Auritidibacter ignavus]|uniref:NADP-dependent oxidoreductase n=1 Tax=Auritidibacter ignavus TaxID=678932 RepID=UPI001604D18A|nr:NADP-dependent oxidoreductase [Auritidibacter ignavus]NIH72555.1 hypothetical protein [Auritidibacter ignavus]WGH83432.1 NADP-dependent oxidoreductase [Auritidibacter ignavus]